MKFKPWQNNAISAAVIIVGGFILFLFAFVLASGVFQLTMQMMGVPSNEAPPVLSRIIYLAIVYVMSGLVFGSKFNDTIKATAFTMPLMVTLMLMGISLYLQPTWIIIGLGAVIVLIPLLFFFKKKMPWQYYFSTFFVVAVLLYMIIFDVEI